MARFLFLLVALTFGGNLFAAAPTSRELSDFELEALQASVLAGVKIFNGWTPEVIFRDEKAGGSLPAIVLLSKENQSAFVRGKELLVQAPITDYQLLWTGEANQFVLRYEISASGMTPNEYAITDNWKSGPCNQIFLGSNQYGRFPSLLFQKENQYASYNGRKVLPSFQAHSVEPLISNGDHSLFKVVLQEEPQQIVLLEDGLFSEPYQEILDWNVTPQNELQYLVVGLDGKAFYKSNHIFSKHFDFKNKIEIYNHRSRELEAAYPIFNNDSWWIYYKGKLLGPSVQIPQALQLLSNGDFIYAQFNSEKNRWFWYRNSIPLVDTEFYDFSYQDAIVYGDHYAVIRRQGLNYQVYADFEVRISLKSKPQCTFINDNLLKIEGKDKNPFYGLYQLETQKLYTQDFPIEVLTFQDDAFDFWLKKPGGWTAYREGLPLGQVKSDDPEKLISFVVNRTLFFPVWDHEKGIMLFGEGGELGPFKTLTPLERPERRESKSHLFSSLIGTTKEGVTAIYGDAIIGPADRITPYYPWNNPYEVKGLLVEFADISYFYSVDKGMMPLPEDFATKNEFVAGETFVADDLLQKEGVQNAE